jgi:hypothetical protein
MWQASPKKKRILIKGETPRNAAPSTIQNRAVVDSIVVLFEPGFEEPVKAGMNGSPWGRRLRGSRARRSK